MSGLRNYAQVSVMKNLDINAGVEIGAFQIGHKRAERRLGRETLHAINGYIDDVSTRFRGAQLGCNTSSSSVMCMHVNRHIRKLSANRGDCGGRAERHHERSASFTRTSGGDSTHRASLRLAA